MGSNEAEQVSDGKSVWATDRCSPGIAPGCLGTKAILKDERGITGDTAIRLETVF